MYGISQPSQATPFDNTSNGFTSTNAQAAIEEAKTSLLYYSTSATSTLTSTSSTFATVGSMTLTPIAGTYLIMFSADIETGSVNGRGELQLFNGGTAVAGTNRELELEVALLLGLIGTARIRAGASCFFGIVTANGTNAIDVRYRSVDGQTITIKSRAMIAIRVAL